MVTDQAQDEDDDRNCDGDVLVDDCECVKWGVVGNGGGCCASKDVSGILPMDDENIPPPMSDNSSALDGGPDLIPPEEIMASLSLLPLEGLDAADASSSLQSGCNLIPSWLLDNDSSTIKNSMFRVATKVDDAFKCCASSEQEDDADEELYTNNETIDKKVEKEATEDPLCLKNSKNLRKVKEKLSFVANVSDEKSGDALSYCITKKKEEVIEGKNSSSVLTKNDTSWKERRQLYRTLGQQARKYRYRLNAKNDVDGRIVN